MNRLHVDDAELLAQKFAEKLQQARSVSDSVHYDHHVWITERIEREKAKRLLIEELTRHVAKWGMVSVLSFVFYAVWLAAKDAVHRP